MAKVDKIHIKLEICKDKETKGLTITTHFDQNAPNFSKDKEGYYWMPTIEERDLINEAFELIPIDKVKSYSEKTSYTPPEKKETKPPSEPPTKEETKPPSEPPTKEETKQEEIETSFETEEEPVDLTPEEKFDKTEVFEVEEEVTEETKSKESDKETKEEDDGILVEADDQAIEAALKKREEKDETIVEADEQTIIEKVLSQKKKGRWSKGH